MSGTRIRAGTAYVELSVVNRMQAGLRNAQANFARFGLAATRAGAMLTGMGIAGGAAILKITNEFMKFDDTMRAAAARTGNFDRSLVELSETARHLGATTSYTATQVGEMIGELTKAGKTAAEIKKLAPAILNVAKATGMATNEAAEMVAQVSGMFERTDFSRVGDILVAAANQSMMGVSDLKEALTEVGTIANSAGNSLEQTAGMIMVLADAGVKGSKAGTQLKNVLNNISKEAEMIERTLGISIGQGNLKNLPDLMYEFSRATKDMTQRDRVALFIKLFKKLGMTGANVLTKNTKKTAEMIDMLESGTMSAADLAEKMESGLGGSMRKMKSAFQEVILMMGQSFAPTIEVIAQSLRVLFGLIGKVGGALKFFAPVLITIVVATLVFGAALMGVGLAAILASIAMGTLSAMINIGTAAWSLYTIAQGIATGGLSLVVAALILVPIAMAAVGAAIGVLIIAMTDWQKVLDDMKGRWKEVAADFEDALKGFKMAVDIYLGNMNVAFKEFWDVIELGASQLLTKTLHVLFGDWAKYVKANIVIVISAWKAFWEMLDILVQSAIMTFETMRFTLIKLFDLLIKITTLGQAGIESFGISVEDATDRIIAAEGKFSKSIDARQKRLEEFGKWTKDFMQGDFTDSINDALIDLKVKSVGNKLLSAMFGDEAGINKWFKDNFGDGAKEVSLSDLKKAGGAITKTGENIWKWAKRTAGEATSTPIADAKEDAAVAGRAQERADNRWYRNEAKKMGIGRAAQTMGAVGSFSASGAAAKFKQQNSFIRVNLMVSKVIIALCTSISSISQNAFQAEITITIFALTYFAQSPNRT